MRTFETGATRDSDTSKPDYEGFLSPLVVERFGQYMHRHRQQADGNLRASDNWQKGIPFTAYIKSMWRHFMDLWQLHRGNPVAPGIDVEEACCALLFNVQGYLHETLKAKAAQPERSVSVAPITAAQVPCRMNPNRRHCPECAYQLGAGR